MGLIKRLDVYRLENKISQQSLAAKLGVSFVTVNRWLNDKTKPSKIQQYHIRKLIKINYPKEEGDK
jgi:transcriptional regulator with XRE-family HTH domain